MASFGSFCIRVSVATGTSLFPLNEVPRSYRKVSDGTKMPVICSKLAWVTVSAAF